MARTKHTQRKSSKAKGGAKHKRLVSWRDMQLYIDTRGYQRVEPEELLVGSMVLVRVDKYADQGGREASVLWRAVYQGSERNESTGTPFHLLEYKCSGANVLYPQHRGSLQFFPGLRVCAKDTDVLFYARPEAVNACGCKLLNCYFCSGNSDD